MPDKLSIATCRHSDGSYSLSIYVDNRTVALRSLPYPQRPGNHSTVDLFDLQPEDVLALGNELTREAFRIKAEQQRINVGGAPCETPSS